MSTVTDPLQVAGGATAGQRPVGRIPYVGAALRRVGGDRLGLILALVALAVFMGVLAPDKFLRPINTMNIILATSVIGLVAIAETVVMVSGGLDVSVSAIVGIASVSAAIGVRTTGSWELGIAAGLLMGALAGAINGGLVTIGRMNAVIATLATVSVFSGFAYILTGGMAVGISHETYNAIGNGRVMGIPIPVIIMGVVALLVSLALSRTDLGRNLYALGGNPAAARLAGINLDRYRMGIYIMGGLICGLAGVITSARTNSGIPTTAQTDLNFQAITAAVLGGTALSGGKGTIVGTLLGVLIIGTLNNGMIILNVQTFWQMVARGLLLIFAVLLQYLQSRKR